VCFVRASELLRARNFAGSIVWLRKCVDLAPGDSKYHAMLARSLSTLAEYRDEAILHYEKAIELDPWNAAALFQLGELYEQMQLPWRARPLYEKVLEVSPLHAKARARLDEFDLKEKEEKASPVSRWFSKKG
jgi:tetratricopeptide (TPR) repeat protein